MHRSILGALATLAACSNGTAAPTPSAPAPAPSVASAPPASGPRFSAAGELEPPRDFRRWQFLTSGFGMAYGPAAASGVQMHDNVYVRPEVYEAFLATGKWPEHTMFVLEVRAAESEGSINHGGQFQTDLAGLEVEVKDSQRFAGGWGFYAFDTDEDGPSKPAQLLPASAACYACHARNAAVENTFTQFYPTLFKVARAHGTVRADFVGLPATVGELSARIAAEGWPAGERLLAEVAAKWPGASVLREPALNQLGYRLLGAGKQPEAVAVLAHVTEKFPTSANAWDSLSEAYESAGDRDGARRALGQARRQLAADRTMAPARREAIDKGLSERAARLGVAP